MFDKYYAVVPILILIIMTQIQSFHFIQENEKYLMRRTGLYDKDRSLS